MSKRRIRLVALRLRYGGGLVLHTATSGAIPELCEVRLLADEDGELCAVGSTRTNIAYLSGLAAGAVEAAILDAARRLDWSLPWGELTAQVDARCPELPAPARMLFEMEAVDGMARARRQPLAASLGVQPGTSLVDSETNQTLFWQDDASLVARARAYAARGFMQLKLRIAVGNFAEDLRRLRLLRDELGPAARLSVDANGRWDEASAPGRLEALAKIGIEYVEQPLGADEWDATARISRHSPIPIMLDESLASMAAIERLAATRAAPLAHLKLAKLGGLDRLMAAGRRLTSCDIGVMVGQMNEGIVSTLAAAHAAIALGAPLRELYGADQLVGDPALPAPDYQDGLVWLPAGDGLGVTGHPIQPHCSLLWSSRS